MDSKNVESFVAGEDLSAKQFHFVKLHTDGTVKACAATTDKPIGVLQNDPTSGQAALVKTAGLTEVIADSACAINDILGTSADGQAAPYLNGTDTTKYGMGDCTKAASSGRAQMLLRYVGLLT